MKPIATPDEYDDKPEDLPRDLDDLLQRLMRRAAARTPHLWKQCDSPQCRRERRCADAATPCFSRAPQRPASPEEDARLRSELQRALRARLGRHS